MKKTIAEFVAPIIGATVAAFVAGCSSDDAPSAQDKGAIAPAVNEKLASMRATSPDAASCPRGFWTPSLKLGLNFATRRSGSQKPPDANSPSEAHDCDQIEYPKLR
ncbi:hypothetical protein [Paraburkholderia elongata]|uniref:Lipoprotein n=1 Tax=Paraburkholderia elongata TaxID=2675747 RepID=A0A972NX80_9BURK|nr:hypothetical protein [Paraburkholderia elongata]NPT61401.1 hypothetical protein [Paraburkholderia elongata]